MSTSCVCFRLTSGYSGSDLTALAKDASLGPIRGEQSILCLSLKYGCVFSSSSAFSSPPLVCMWFYVVVGCSVWFYRVLCGSIEFCGVLCGSIEFCGVLCGSMAFCGVLGWLCSLWFCVCVDRVETGPGEEHGRPRGKSLTHTLITPSELHNRFCCPSL